MRIACIGTRELLPYQHSMLWAIGRYYAQYYQATVLSGNAPGADQAFAHGASVWNSSQVELYLPWPEFEQRAVIEGNKLIHVRTVSSFELELAERACQTDWNRIRPTVKPLLVRDAMVANRCDWVLALPKNSGNGQLGGTGHTMRAARLLGKPVWRIDIGSYWQYNEP